MEQLHDTIHKLNVTNNTDYELNQPPRNVVLRLILDAKKKAEKNNINITNCYNGAVDDLKKFLFNAAIDQLLKNQKPFVKNVENDLKNLETALADGQYDLVKADGEGTTIARKSQDSSWYMKHASFLKSYEIKWRNAMFKLFEHFKKNFAALQRIIKNDVELYWRLTHVMYVNIYSTFYSCVINDHPQMAGRL